MYGLLDCESFYVSCERLFRPDLANRSVMVLSNNDGCVIALSSDLKERGMAIGMPYFKVRACAKQDNIAVFSSNFPLYGDLSARVMHCLQAHVGQMEIYSIDEAFFAVPQSKLANEHDATAYASRLRDLVMRWVGVPVRIGLGKTKTLAKVAQHLAKKTTTCVCVLTNDSPHVWRC